MSKNNNLKAFLDDLLTEDAPVPAPTSAAAIAPVEAPKDLSFDQVIDRYLIRYEKESIPTSQDYEEGLYDKDQAQQQPGQPAPASMPNNNTNVVEHFSRVVEEALSVIKEAEPEEEDAGLDLAADEASGEEEPAPEEDSAPKDDGTAPVINTPQINLNDFARSVARLINNYDALLNPKDIILNRAEAYITSNYDQRTAKEFMDLLDTNYSLRTPQAQNHSEEESNLGNPYAQGALSKEG